MQREELEQLNNLRKEITELNEEIYKIQQQEHEAVTDKVRASGNDFPYIDGFRKISGIDRQAECKREKNLSKKLALIKERRKKAAETELKLIEYINSVPDSRVRRIMQYRYVEGFTWEKIATIMNYDKSYPQRIIAKYLDSN